MHEITFECQILTPMFIGGAMIDDCELRAPSIKGAMRYWWRALHGDLSLKELKEKEAGLFGSPNEKHGKSKVKIKITDQLPTVSPCPNNLLEGKLSYLLYGMDKRKYLMPDNTFNVNVQYPDEALKPMILKLINLVGFGGVGSKSRNGFGKFVVKGTSFQKLEDILGSVDSKQRNYTALSENATLFYQKHKYQAGQWNDCLSGLCQQYEKAKKKVRKKEVIAAPLGDQFLFRHPKTHFISVLPTPYYQDGGQKFKLQGCIYFMKYDYLDGLEKIDEAKLEENYKIKRYQIKEMKKNYEGAIKAFNDSFLSQNFQ